MNYYLGIDVGTGSARAGIFDVRGKMAAAATQPIKMWKPAPDHVEQSSDDIWRACARATRAALFVFEGAARSPSCGACWCSST
jgi:D-ribulokinase